MKSTPLKIFIVVACLAAGAMFPARSFAAKLVWNATYTSGNGDFPHSVAVDPSGNVYITGNNLSGRAVLRTIKYNSAGSIIWNVVNDSGDSDYSAGIAVDPSGNVYVAGSTLNNTSIRIIKYDSAGNLIWNITSTGGSIDYAAGVAVDPSGNVYVAGSTWDGNVMKHHFRIMKYNSAGSIIWNVVKDTGNIDNVATGVAVDPSGNVYVAEGENGTTNIGTYKYNTAGGLVWGVALGSGDDKSSGIAVDPSGNVYVVDYYYTPSTLYTIKFDSAGNFNWRSTTNDEFVLGYRNVAVDPSGNVYVPADGGYGKLNSSGAVVSNSPGGGPVAYTAAAVDSSGYVYLTGWSNDGTNYFYNTSKFAQQCNGPTTFSFTDPTLTAGTTPIRTVHLTELRNDINSLRTDAGLSAFSFTDPTLTAGTTPIRTVHINELRTALADVYTTCGQAAPTYTDATLTGGTSLIRSVDISELRAKVLQAP